MAGTEGATATDLRPIQVVRQFQNVRHDPTDTTYGPKTWEFTQGELSFFEKNEFVRVVSGALDFALQSGMGLMDIIAAFSSDENGDGPRMGNILSENAPATTSIVGVALRFVAAVPDLLVDVYLLALKVPPRQRDGVRASLVQIDDELGFAIFDTFIDQNGEAIRRYLAQWWSSLQEASKKLGMSETISSATEKVRKKKAPKQAS